MNPRSNRSFADAIGAVRLWTLITFAFSVVVRAAGPATIPNAVPTFECVGLYWLAPGGAADKPCEVSYRASGATDWQPALPLWFDGRNQEYRGSIVYPQPGTTYEIALLLKGSATRASLQARTWSEAFPEARTITVPVRSRETPTVTESGSPDGYVVYTPAANPGGATIDVANAADLNGKDLGVVWTAPWSVELAGTVKPGHNELEIDVVNTWGNRLIGDAGLPKEKRSTKTNLALQQGPRTLKAYQGFASEDPLMRSGLLGPVRLELLP